MRKISIMIFAVSIILSSCISCFGQTIDNNIVDQINPQFVATQTHGEMFYMESGRKLTAEASLIPQSSQALDKVIINIRVIKVSNGKECYYKSITTTYDNIWLAFHTHTSYVASEKGSYQMNCTYKCYKSRRLL